jgi:DUF1009 family protein
MKRLGLIAGAGDFPVLFATAAKKKGITLVCVAISGEASSLLANLTDSIHWVSLGEAKKTIDIFKKEGIKKAVMLGSITKTRFFKDRPQIDDGASLILKFAKDKRDLTLFRAAAMVFGMAGIKLINPLFCLKENVAKKGCLTRRALSKRELKDIRFGVGIARKLASLDVGQTVAVKDKVILAAEAIDGTDETIKRAGILGDGNIVVVKVARPHQDMRFDIPVIGINTIYSLKEARASCLALEKNKMLITNKDEIVKLADDAGIAIVVI